jgi:hypothetical protein
MPSVAKLVDPSQKGFLEGVNGHSHILDINSFFYNGVENDQDRFLFLLDTNKAFDSIDHDWIHFILDHCRFPRWFRLYVKNCLLNVFVTPFFGSFTNIWIPIVRGVKQGCPLSPLLFIISYDPLLFFLRNLPEISFFAFADDLVVASHHLQTLFPVFSLIDTFSLLSGLGVNRDKSCIVPSAPSLRFDYFRSLLALSSWPDIPFREKATHLGIVLGRLVTLDDIWEVPMKKAISRINSSFSFVHSLPLHKRILFVNVFIVSIFSYVGLFYVLPSSLWKIIRHAIVRLIIPFNGSAFSYESLVCSKILFKHSIFSNEELFWK